MHLRLNYGCLPAQQVAGPRRIGGRVHNTYAKQWTWREWIYQVLLTKPEEDIANRKLQISLRGTGASLQFQMRDLTSRRAALHIKTRRLKLLFVGGGGGGGGGSGGWLWICCGGAHTNVLAGRTLPSCQILVIGAAEKVTLGGEEKKNNAGKYNEPRLCCEKVSTEAASLLFQ